MNDTERFLRLSETYRALTKTAYDNLAILKAWQQANAVVRFFTWHPLKRMKPFDLGKQTDLLRNTRGGKTYAFILGEVSEQLSFYPSITEKMIKIHSVANFVNAALKSRRISSEEDLVRPLQDALMEFYFLDKTFAYYAQRTRLINGKIQNAIDKKGEVEALNVYYQEFLKGLTDVIKPCLDIDHLQARIRQYEFKAYAWLTNDVGEDGKVVNNYYLPKQYWQPFVNWMAAEQAKAMAH